MEVGWNIDLCHRGQISPSADVVQYSVIQDGNAYFRSKSFNVMRDGSRNKRCRNSLLSSRRFVCTLRRQSL